METVPEKVDIMKYESALPADFDGVFRFTNWSSEEFVGKWGGKEYHFEALKTSPIVMPEFSPLEIQNIRKKFAKDLAEREFFRSTQYGKFQAQERNNDGSARLNSIHSAGTYSMTDLTPFIKKCLEPLPIAQALVRDTPKAKIEDTLSRNDEGELNTTAIDSKTSLRQKALQA